MRTCDQPGCDRRHYGHGLCKTHWKRQANQRPCQHPGCVSTSWGADLCRAHAAEQRHLWSLIEITGCCWLWSGTTWNGYGRLKHRGQRRLAHRLVYELLVGPIPDGLSLDHLCAIKTCVNPDHLQPVTLPENAVRAHQHARHDTTLRAAA